MNPILGIFALSLFSAVSAGAQTISSGADGALDLAAMNCTDCVVQLPPTGVLNYTTVNVPGGKTLRFKPNLSNTPVVLLAQGDVNVGGVIDVSQDAAWFVVDPQRVNNGLVRLPGPGGFFGGANGQPGFGPGGGAPNAPGQWVGPLSLVPLTGGSGGGGNIISNPPDGCAGHAGSGGGGALVIASSTQITVSGSVNANGGAWAFYNGWCYSFSAGGAGGAIRLVANSISVSGSLNAVGGQPYWAQSAGPGVIRLEAATDALSFTGSASPSAVLSTINPAILLATIPSLAIVSIGGYPVPSHAGQRFDTVDLLLPLQLPDPIDVVVSASNIPVGAQVNITFGTSNGGTVIPGTLTGTIGSSSATVQISGLNRAQLAYLYVSTTFDVPQNIAMLGPPSGPDHVAAVRATAAPGAATQYAFLRTDGSSIDSSRLPPAFLKQFQRS
jgi:hypothetical protein